MPYTWCPNCTLANEIESVEFCRHRLEYESDEYDESNDINLMEYHTDDTKTFSSDISININMETDSLNSSLNEYIKNFEDKSEYRKAMENLRTKPNTVERQTQRKPCPNHYLVMESSTLMNVLRSYTKTYLNANQVDHIATMVERLRRNRSTVSRLLSNSDVTKFWRRFQEIFSIENIKLWTALEKGIEVYLSVLQKRDRLDTECEYLRRQNAELKYVLKEYQK